MMKTMMKAMLVMATMGALSAWGQRPAVPAAGAPTLACGQPNATDTVVSNPDSEGYRSLFDGTSFKGWFQGCQTAHGGPAVMRINTAEQVIYHASNNNTGGLMFTNKTFGNYEIFFEWWPTYGNDGGVFNRSNLQGYCFQTVLDYLGGASVGGVWAERGILSNNPVSRDIRPWRYNSVSALNIPGSPPSWTDVTRRDPNRASYGCPNGCASTDYARLWDANGWVQMRVKFYGGLTAGTRIQMASFFKRPSSNAWVPIYHDSTLTDGPIKAIPAGFIGFQVHAGGSFQSGNNGNFYRNIKWRALDNQGNPLGVTDVKSGMKDFRMDIRSLAGALQGSIDQNHEITVKDLSGRVLESFSGGAGEFRYAFTSRFQGMMVVQVKTQKSTRNFRIVRTNA